MVLAASTEGGPPIAGRGRSEPAGRRPSSLAQCLRSITSTAIIAGRWSSSGDLDARRSHGAPRRRVSRRCARSSSAAEDETRSSQTGRMWSSCALGWRAVLSRRPSARRPGSSPSDPRRPRVRPVRRMDAQPLSAGGRRDRPRLPLRLRAARRPAAGVSRADSAGSRRCACRS